MKVQRLTYLLLFILLFPFLSKGQDIDMLTLKSIDSLDSWERYVERPQIQEDVYKNPQVKIVAQNKKLLGYSLIWDEDTTLKVSVVSIIGNVLFSEEIAYEGIPIEAVVDVHEYPTGIYLLKISDSEERTILLRKFTKY